MSLGRRVLQRVFRVLRLPFGAIVKLPEPVNIALDSEPLKEFVG